MFTMQILDGQLGLTPPSIAGASVDLGIASDGLPGTLYTAGDVGSAVAQLGQGPMVEALADRLTVAGGPGYAMPLNPSTVGTVSATTYGGTGTGTVVASLAPHKEIKIKIEAGGTPTTMTFRYAVGGAAYSAIQASGAGPYVFLVPGTLCKVTFTNVTFTALDVFTVSTAGAVTVVGTGPANQITQASSPVDVYDIRVTITTSGALGVAVFNYSLDGGNTVSGQIAVPSGGVYVLPNTGVVLTFAGTFTAHALPYTIATVAAAFTTSDVNTAMTLLLANALEWSFVHVVGQATSAAGAATMASTLDTHMQTAEVAFRYVFAVTECPTTETDSTVAAAFASFVSKRVAVCAGDIGHLSSITPGKVTRRNCGTVVASKIASARPGTSIAWVEDPPNPLKSVKSLYRSGIEADILDAGRFTTVGQKTGVIGYFVVHGQTMASPGSDFTPIYARRVMDVACRVTRASLLPYTSQKIPVNPAGQTNAGKIQEKWAVAKEALIRKKLLAALNIGPGAGDDADAVDASVVFDRNEPILSTKTFKVAVRVTPFGYAENIAATIGFQNPAL